MVRIIIPTEPKYGQMQKIGKIVLNITFISAFIFVISLIASIVIMMNADIEEERLIEPSIKTATIISNDINTLKEFGGNEYIEYSYNFDKNGKIIDKKEILKENVYLINVDDKYEIIEIPDNTYGINDNCKVLEQSNYYKFISQDEEKEIIKDFNEKANKIDSKKDLSISLFIISMLSLFSMFISDYIYVKKYQYYC